MRKQLGIVVPRCGANALGGAEAFALQIARDLLPSHDAEIITTCAEDYWTWENVYPPGLGAIGIVPVRRFPVDAPRDVAAFNRLSRGFRYRIGSLTTAEQEHWIRTQGPYSSAMLRYLVEGDAHDAFIFVSYLYASTYFGLPLVRDRALLVPLAHDEWPIYMPVWRTFFASVASWASTTPESIEAVRRIFPGQSTTSEIIYPSVARDYPEPVAAEAGDPYMLFLGRIDESKGVSELIGIFERFREANPQSRWSLVLAGPGHEPSDGRNGVRFAGAVDEAEKWRLLQNCALFAMPSYHESLCIAMLEAWSAGRPSLVNGWNPILVGQSTRSNGGLWYRDQQSFNACMTGLDAPTRATLGRQGQAYVQRHYRSGNVIDVVERAMARMGR